MVYYRNTQYIGVAVAVPVFVLAVTAVIVSQQEVSPYVYLTMGALIAGIILMHSLTVIVDDRYLHAQYGIKLVKFKIKLRDIVNAEEVRTPWWYGYGIRIVPGGWMYSISGRNAVKLHMKNGRSYHIGSNDSTQLANVIKERIGK